MTMRLLSRVLFCLITFFFFSPPPVQADLQWSLSVVEGFYYPKLDDLNRTLTQGALELGPRKLDARPVSYPVIYQGPTPVMPEMSPKTTKFGLQMQAEINPRYTAVMGGSIGVLESYVRDIRPFFVGFNIDSTRETRFSLTLNQIWIGVRRNWEIGKVVSERPSPRIYGEIGIIGITGATLNTDVWLHVYAPEEGFDFYKVTTTVSEGRGYATYLGVGGEYFFYKRLSFGADIQYVFGGVKDLKFTRFFTVDPLEEGLIKVGDTVTVTDLNRGSRVPLFLSLDGWDFKGMIRFYF